jgi:phosphopantetheinyl transferase
VDVWLVALDTEAEGEHSAPRSVPRSASAAPADDTLLSADEKVRAARFIFEADRVRWTRARSSLRTILSECSGIPAGEIRFVTGEHGKPALAGETGIEFNLSHSGSWAMVAVTRRVPVGIDIERIREKVNIASLLEKLGVRDLPSGVENLFHVWTRREAMTKALGGALLTAPAGDFRIRDLDAPAGYAASLALIGYEPQVRVRDAMVPPISTI